MTHPRLRRAAAHALATSEPMVYRSIAAYDDPDNMIASAIGLLRFDGPSPGTKYTYVAYVDNPDGYYPGCDTHVASTLEELLALVHPYDLLMFEASLTELAEQASHDYLCANGICAACRRGDGEPCPGALTRQLMRKGTP